MSSFLRKIIKPIKASDYVYQQLVRDNLKMSWPISVCCSFLSILHLLTTVMLIIKDREITSISLYMIAICVATIAISAYIRQIYIGYLKDNQKFGWKKINIILSLYTFWILFFGITTNVVARANSRNALVFMSLCIVVFCLYIMPPFIIVPYSCLVFGTFLVISAVLTPMDMVSVINYLTILLALNLVGIMRFNTLIERYIAEESRNRLYEEQDAVKWRNVSLYSQELQYFKASPAANLLSRGHYDLTADQLIMYEVFNDSTGHYDDLRAVPFAQSFGTLWTIASEEKDGQILKDTLNAQYLINAFSTGTPAFNISFPVKSVLKKAEWLTLTIHLFESPVNGNVEVFLYLHDETRKHLEDLMLRKFNDFGFLSLGYIDTKSETMSAFFYEEGKETKRLNMDYNDREDIAFKRTLSPEKKAKFLEKTKLSVIIDGLEKSGNTYQVTFETDSNEILQIEHCWLDKNLGLIFYITSNITAEVAREQKRIQELKEAITAAQASNKAKTVFLSNMSHDIRTPMNAIVGFATIAANHPEDSHKVQESLKKILSASTHLQRLINDILDMSRIESGKTVLNEVECSIFDIIDGIIPILQPMVESKKLFFSMETYKVINDHIYADPLKMSQILINLLSNAVKYTAANGRVTLSISQQESGNSEIANYTFIVKDTGVGMSEEFLTKIFQPFERETTSTLSGVEGTGLGLSIAKSLVEMMQGTLSVKSKLGEGSEFTLEIPFRVCEAPDIKDNTSASEISEPIDFSSLHLLLVEDNELNREIAVEVLSEAGFTSIDTAENGAEASDKLLNSSPGDYDLVLMDIQMPVMNGYDAARRIRSSGREDLQKLPIIAMTANAFEEDKKLAIDSGMNDHIAKPLDIRAMMSTIQKNLALIPII